jgi:hypothetical protein
MASGRYTFTRTGEGQYAAISFTHSDLGLPEPSVSNLETHPSVTNLVTQPTIAVVPQSSESEPLADCANRPATQEAIDLEFAAKYKAGLVEDSYGNRIGEARPLTALGPMEPKPKKKFDGAEHMDQRLIGTSHPVRGIDGEFIVHAGSDNHPLVALGRKAEPALRHPNQTRQELLNAIRVDLRNGWSR